MDELISLRNDHHRAFLAGVVKCGEFRRIVKAAVSLYASNWLGEALWTLPFEQGVQDDRAIIDAIEWKSPFGLRLLAGRYVIGALGYEMWAVGPMVRSIVDVPWCRDDFHQSMGRQILLKTLVEISKLKPYREVRVLPFDRRDDRLEEGQSGYQDYLVRAKLNHDVTACSLGFVLDETVSFYSKKLTAEV